MATFDAGASAPVDIEVGPGRALYYVDFNDGRIRRVRYSSSNQYPTAVATATPTSGNAPLTVAYDGSDSSDPDPATRSTYAWDLDGDGQYDDSASATPAWTYTHSQTVIAGLRVTDEAGASDASHGPDRRRQHAAGSRDHRPGCPP